MLRVLRKRDPVSKILNPSRSRPVEIEPVPIPIPVKLYSGSRSRRDRDRDRDSNRDRDDPAGLYSRASDSSDSDTIRSVFGPHLHSVVGCIEHIDRSVGDEDVIRLTKLGSASSWTRTKDSHSRVRTGLNDDDSIVDFICDVQCVIVGSVYALIRIQRR